MAEERYTHGHHESVIATYRWRSAENSAGYLLAHLAPGLSLLDVGCGPGSVTVGLAARVAPGEVVAIDAAEGVLADAAATAELAGAPAIRFERGDVYELAYPDGAFDVVHAHQVLQHLSDPVAALSEMRRVCRPGGVVAARDADYAAMTWYPEPPGVAAWRECYESLARRNGGEPDAGRRLRAWALEAGFSEVHSSASVWMFGSAEEREYWGGGWAARVVESDFAAQALKAGLATEADLAGFAEGWRAWAAAEAGSFFVVHGEVLCRP